MVAVGMDSKGQYQNLRLPKKPSSINVNMAYFSLINSVEKHVGAAFYICMLCLIRCFTSQSSCFQSCRDNSGLKQYVV